MCVDKKCRIYLQWKQISTTNHTLLDSLSRSTSGCVFYIWSEIFRVISISYSVIIQCIKHQLMVLQTKAASQVNPLSEPEDQSSEREVACGG